jgi:predicted RNase H-like HicB family nuclease
MLVKIETYRDGKFWCARGVGEDVFTQGKTLDELYANIQEAVALHFEDRLKSAPVEILILTEAEIKRVPKAAAG